jgi:ribonucleoside-triphosphate reductase (formate)
MIQPKMKKLNNVVDNYLNQLDWEVKENSNAAYSLQGLNSYLSAHSTKQYWLENIYPKEICKVALNGDMHIHDLQTLATYCVGWDLQDLLRVGFKGAQTKIESKPPKHFRTSLGQLVNFFYTLQGESAGAQAVSSFDTLLAPFIRYDNLSYSEILQLIQEFLFNMNTPTRVGFQSPFTNVTLDLIPPKNLEKEHVIIGGELQKETYGEFQQEMNLFNRAFTEIISKGDAKGKVFSYPLPTYNITKDFDWDNPNLDGLWKMTAKYGIPNFSNFINSDMSPEDARSMCCRLRLDNRELRKRGGGLFGANPLTGSIGVVTVNLPRIGYLSKTKTEFFSRLEKVMELAKKSLEIKRKTLERLTDAGLYPYAKFYLRNTKNRFGSYWSNHFSTIGLTGMNEACLNFFGKNIATEQGLGLSKEVLDFMREKIMFYQDKTTNLYNLEATPAEATSYRLAKKDRELYPNIIVANSEQMIKDTGVAPFYTNSTHLPVDYTKDVFELLDLQDELQIKYTGGTIVHIFLGEEIRDYHVVKKLVKKICENYKLPYFTLTPTFSICTFQHGYIAGKHFSCPECGEKTIVYSRVVGHLLPVQQWNVGKRSEFSIRNTYEESINKIVYQKDDSVIHQSSVTAPTT